MAKVAKKTKLALVSKRPDAKPVRLSHSLKMAWGDVEGLDLLHVDHSQLQGIGDCAYLTFGQVRMPLSPPEGESVVEIRPVARLVLSEKAIKALRDLLNRNLVGG